MFNKFALLAVLATVGFAQDRSDVPVHADNPMPSVPNDFVAKSYHYTYQGNRLFPSGTWSTQKWSSKLNKILGL